MIYSGLYVWVSCLSIRFDQTIKKPTRLSLEWVSWAYMANHFSCIYIALASRDKLALKVNYKDFRYECKLNFYTIDANDNQMSPTLMPLT